MDIGDRVVVVSSRFNDDKYKDEIGTVTEVYEGWMFCQYAVLLDKYKEEIVFYHDEVKELK